MKKKKKNGRMKVLVMLHDDNRRGDDEEGGMKRVTRPRARLDFFWRRVCEGRRAWSL